MKIYLMRHFKVNYNWKSFYNSKQFDNACKDYDQSPVIPYVKKIINLKNVYTSTLLRTKETAAALKIDSNIKSTKLLDEVPLKSFADYPFLLPTFLWMIMGRIQWYLGCERQIEIKPKTKDRIIKLIEIIESENQDCLLIGHGFYFSQMKRILKKKNYIGNNRNYYKNGHMAEFTKKSI